MDHQGLQEARSSKLLLVVVVILHVLRHTGDLHLVLLLVGIQRFLQSKRSMYDHCMLSDTYLTDLLYEAHGSPKLRDEHDP